jgi:hypothetical protein
MLNIFLLTLKLKPADFVGTRATFFCVINSAKMGMRIYNGSLSTEMLTLGFKLGGLAVSEVFNHPMYCQQQLMGGNTQVIGVFGSTLIVKRLSKALFMKMEYTLMTYASLKLLNAGLHLGIEEAIWKAVVG